MPFNDIELHKIKKAVGSLCDKRTPQHKKDQLRYEYEIEKQNVFIYEIRPLWNNPKEFTKLSFAKLTYVKSQRIWKLYWQKANEKWIKYTDKNWNKSLGALIQEIDYDKFGCFFG